MTGELGNTTKFSSHGENQAQFASQYGSTALRFYLLEIARTLLPEERIKVCWRYPLPARRAVEIIYSEERKSARAAGTMKCGSGWVCPACMQYIATRRREELQTAINRASDEYFSLMVTYTARHHAGQRLDSLLDAMTAAYGGVFSGRWWMDTKEEFGLMGAIRALEVTYGDNGWHPHFHVIMFVSRHVLEGAVSGPISPEQEVFGSPGEYAGTLQPLLEGRWMQQLRNRGLDSISGIACDVRSADQQIAEYVTKFGRMPQEWTLNANAYELAHSNAKTPRNGNLSVLDLLFNAPHDTRARGLFLEYAAATKGKSAIHWSKGLKKRLDVEVIRDELAAEGVETDTDRMLAEIEIAQWRYIVDRGHLAQVMTYANAGDDEKLARLLEVINSRYESTFERIPQIDIGL